MFEYRCKLSLWISHPTDDLKDIPARLGLSVGRVWKAGDPRATPKGKSLEGIYSKSRCGISLQEESVDSLPDLLRVILPKLRKHKAVFDELELSGASVSLFVGWFSESINSRDVLDWKILAEMAELKISLDLDIYGPDETDQTIARAENKDI